MGRRGPPRTPTKILALRDSTQVWKRKREPQPPAEKPPCPAWLDPDARKMWRTITPELARIGILARIDQNALARYCHLWVRWRAEEMRLTTEGMDITTYNADGQLMSIQPSPAVARASNLADKLLKLEQQFGMTPSARASLRVEAPVTHADQDPKAKFFRQA